MTQKGKQGRHGNAIGEMAALRWEPTHITKHCPRVVPLQYPRKDKYESRHIVQKRESGHKRRQPRHLDAQRRVMDTMNNKLRWNTYHTTQTRTSTSSRKRNTRTNQKNPNKETRSNKTVGKKRQTIMGRKQNHLHKWQDLCPKKQVTLRQNTQ